MTAPGPAPGGDTQAKRKRKRTAGQGQGGISLNWSLINTLAHQVLSFATGPLLRFLEAESIGATLMYKLGQEVTSALYRVIVKIVTSYIAALRRWTERQLADLRALIWRLYYQTRKLVSYALQLAMDYTRRLVTAERLARQAAVRRAEAEARAEVKAMHQRIEREAASAYQLQASARADLIVRLAGYIVDYEPELRAVVSRLIGWLLDLATVDDPILRALIGFALREVIDRLGVNKAAGEFLRELIAPLLGDPKPHDLHDVIADLVARVAAMEAQWSQFYADGGSQVEDAGKGWQALVAPAADLALLAWVGFAVADPQGWAADLEGTIGRAADDVIAAVTRAVKAV